MTDTDEKIARMLSEDDRAFLDSLDNQRGLFAQIGDTLNGPLAGWTRLMFVVTSVVGFATIYAIWMAFHAEEVRELVLWTAGALVGFVATGFTKDWFFSRMNMLAILREVKRLQVQVALLGEKDG